MYIYVAPPQGQVGSVMVYTDKQRNMVTIDTDEVNTQVGIEIIGVKRLMKKFNLNKNEARDLIHCWDAEKRGIPEGKSRKL